ncbi:Archaeal primase DnaG/twinkle, TOPRIM domain [uncultured Caudovirales phage]|uniref:Archaeal primase DnaG/twinkle, TOPRIM domain n=1 Tax=uncultured Caudovirales phage TaxID=2100421 RepID=A0A6J7WEV4_9CAUD|nr:Archaeal primase DnaG/twinkle, TOPRIM domain [uncultured Caudovirales phage]
MDTETIAKALGNAKKVNGNWLASCPVPGHGRGNGDKNPSLSITENNGKYLFHCHGGCDQHSVFDAVRERNLLPALQRQEYSLALIKGELMTMPQLESEWEYKDEQGETLFVKRRFKVDTEKGKTYSLHKVDSAGRRQGSMTGARIVPYRLPELINAREAGRAIYLVEGEKAADALVSIGAIATTSHAGASHWPADITQYFTGAVVIVVPDCDAPGWKYAKRVVEALLPVAKAIRVLDLNLPELGDDAYEWVQDGGDRAKLAELAKALPVITSIDQVQTPEWIEPRQAEEPITIDHLPEEEPPILVPRQLLNIEPWDDIEDEPVEWLIQDVLPKKAFAALYGPPGSYKSFVALDIAEAVATGRSWMGREVQAAGAVLYICGEGFGGIGARIKACKLHNKTQAGAEIYVIRAAINMRSSAEDFDLLVASIKDLMEKTGVQFELVQIDTLARAFGGGNENNSEDMGAFIHNAGRIQRMLNCAMMVLHHSGKDATKGLRGHSSLLGAVDTQLELLKIDSTTNPSGPIAGSGILTISKQKDGQDGVRIGFEMVKVEIQGGTLGIADPQISLAVRASDEAIQQEMQAQAVTREGKPRKLQENQQVALNSIHKALEKHGRMTNVRDERHKTVSMGEWRDEFVRLKGDSKSIYKDWERGKKAMFAKELVGYHSTDIAEYCWVIYPEDAKDEPFVSPF